MCLMYSKTSEPQQEKEHVCEEYIPVEQTFWRVNETVSLVSFTS